MTIHLVLTVYEERISFWKILYPSLIVIDTLCVGLYFLFLFISAMKCHLHTEIVKAHEMFGAIQLGCPKLIAVTTTAIYVNCILRHIMKLFMSMSGQKDRISLEIIYVFLYLLN